MSQPKIVVVVPSIRPDRMETFRQKWADDFSKYGVTLVTVWDGDTLRVTVDGNDGLPEQEYGEFDVLDYDTNRDLVYHRTDACRNLGFVYAAANLQFDALLTLDDDVWPRRPSEGFNRGEDTPAYTRDPIGDHLRVLSKKVPLSWMNTAHKVEGNDQYVRGFPYGVREEAPVMLSHGVWDGVPDFDGETQLRLTNRRGENGGGIGLPHSLPYYVGPIPKGVRWPLCGMSVMIRREALPYFYFAPMGQDTKVAGLNRFADIYMGLFLKERFDQLGWACYTGGATVYHSRASDPRVNCEQERLGREWLEVMSDPDRTQPPELLSYLRTYRGCRMRYETLINSLLRAATDKYVRVVREDPHPSNDPQPPPNPNVEEYRK